MTHNHTPHPGDASRAGDPVRGCADPGTATQRATDLLGPITRPDDPDVAFWTVQPRRALAALLHAAALGGLGLSDVLGWVADPAGAHQQVAALLRRSPEPALAMDAAQVCTAGARTQTSITTVVAPALRRITDPKKERP